MEKKSLKLNFLMNAILTMSGIIFPLITFPYITRVLLPEGTGKINLAASVIAYFSMLSQLGIPTYGIKICASLRDDRKELTKTVHELVLINLIMAMISYAALMIIIAIVPRLRNEKLLFLVTSITVFLSAIGIEWMYQGLEEYSYITERSLVFKSIALVAMFLLVREQEHYVIYAGINAFAIGASYICNLINSRRYIDLKWLGNYDLKRHCKAILVFFALTCVTTIYTNLDNVMLGFMKTNADVGLYSAAVKIKVLLVSLITSLGAVLLPRASYCVEQGKLEEFKNITRKALSFVILAATPVVVYFMLYADECIRLIAGEAFQGSVLPMQIIMPTVLFIGITNILGIEVMVPTGREKAVLKSTILGAATDVVLNIILIPRFAASGAAIGTLAAELAVLIYQVVYLKDEAKDPLSGVKTGPVIIGIIIAAIPVLLLKKWNTGSFLKLAVTAILFFVIYGIINRKAIVSFVFTDNQKRRIRERMETIRMRDVLIDMWKKKWLVLACLIVCVGAGAFLGYRKYRASQAVTPQEQQEIDFYNETIENMEKTLADTEAGLQAANEEINNLQEYCDESILMQLNPSEVYVANAQFAVHADSEEVKEDDILYAINEFVTEGGGKEPTDAKDEDLKVKYWGDVLTTSIQANTFSVSITQPSEELARRSVELILNRINTILPTIKENHGDFDMDDPQVSTYVKSNMDYINAQNSRTDTLTKYITAKDNTQTNITAQKQNIETYKTDKMPEVMRTGRVGLPKTLAKYAVFGIIAGLVICIGIILLGYVFEAKGDGGKKDQTV